MSTEPNESSKGQLVNNLISMQLLGEGIQGKVIRRIDEGYKSAVYQYAYTSYEDVHFEPNAIIYPNGDEDIITVINFARMHDLGIAIRTGGHHYTGASSTTGRNIQLDLNDTYPEFTISKDDPTVVEVGVSTTLARFLGNLRKAGLFVPTGQCSFVHLGGHVQTGGFGHLIRGFGLLADHVLEFRMITADGEVRRVRRGEADDKELFFAVLGGSPGNFGVLTHVTLRAHRDADHPKSRGMFGMVGYSKSVFKQLLELMVAEGKDEDRPADFDYTLSVIDSRFVEGKLAPIIVIFVQWANLEGKDQDYDPAFFQKIQEIIGVKMDKHEGSRLDGEQAPMSTLCGMWVFPIAREFQLPYFKRTYITNSSAQTLEDDGWVEWVTGRLEKCLRIFNGMHLAAQFTNLGGSKSRFRVNDPDDDMSFSWRRDSTIVCTMDVFYDESMGPSVKANALEWVETNDKEGVGKDGKFCKQDRRLLWGSRDHDLPKAREYYYDSEAKYQTLAQTKKKYDPDLVFTANKFAVGEYRPAPSDLMEALFGWI